MKKLIDFVERFRKEESGAVTVDWVVLTAAVIGLGAVAYPLVQDGVKAKSTYIKAQLLK